jgi:branched-chain amino acid aminotransferase
VTVLIPPYAWLNGTLVAWEDCVVHARTQGAFWGANVFEGLRAYWRPDTESLVVFRIEDHLARLRRSMKSLRMDIGYADADLTSACLRLLAANEIRADVHVCVVAYFGMGENFDPLCHTADTGVHITSTAAPRRAAYREGLHASISSWRRISDDSMPPRIKTGANYNNSRLAQHEAVRHGYGTTFLLNSRGTVAEAPGSCVVMVRDGELVTPPGSSSVLEGITVDTVAGLAAEHLDLRLRRREIDRTELYAADELFICGTLAEIQPVVSVDRIAIGGGAPGPVTVELQRRYDAVVRGDAGDPAWSSAVRLAAARVTTDAA